MARAVEAPAGTTDSHIVVSNGLILLIRRLVLLAFSTVLVLFLPRYLGDQGLGQLAFAQSIAALFATVLSLGLGEFLIKEIARNRNVIATHLSAAVGIRIVMSVLVIAAIFGIANLTSYSNDAKQLIYIAAATAIALSFVRLMASVLHGLEDMSWPAISEVSSRVLVLAVGIPVLVQGLGVVAYASVLFGATLVNLGLHVGYVARRFAIGTSFQPTRVRALLVGGAPFILMGFLLNIYNQTDTVVLRVFTSDAVVGWYAAANNIYKAVDMLPLALTAALLPTLARVHAASSEAAIAIAKKGMVVGALVMVPLGLGISLFSSDIITALPYPEAFQNTVPLLTILGLTIPVTTFLMILGTIAIAVNRQKAWAIALLATVVLNIVLNILAAPYFRDHYGNGGIGVALTTLVSEGFMVAVGVWLLPKGVLDRAMASTFLKIAIAAGAMAVVVLLVRALAVPTPLTAVVGTVAYIALVLVTRAFAVEDMRFVVSVVRRKLKLSDPTEARRGVIPHG